jgi:chorismate synthase
MIAAAESVRRRQPLRRHRHLCQRGCPAGWGEPVFDRLEADLAKGVMSLPASKGFEIGSGFAGTDLTGAEHNDEFYMEGGRIRRTNRPGGVRAASPTARRSTPRRVGRRPPCASSTRSTSATRRRPPARRHDPCVLPRGRHGRGDDRAGDRGPRAAQVVR